MLKDVHPQKKKLLTSFRTGRRLIRYEGCSILNSSCVLIIGDMSTVEPHHGEPVRKKQKKLEIFLGKKTLDKILEKKGDRSVERDGAPLI